MSAPAFIIGIDPGVKTGFAVWSNIERRLIRVSTLKIHVAMDAVRALRDSCEVRYEDARLRQWYGKTGREVLQGVGSVKRDCLIWQEYCAHLGIQATAVKPSAGGTKWTPEYFKKLTKWPRVTSTHGRDATALCFGG